MTAVQGQTGVAAPRCLPPTDESNPTHAGTTVQGGRSVFENDNYRISAGGGDSVTINNKNTGESYEVWGDPHVNVDGQHAFDFHGTTTFNLEDGTKVSVETTPSKDYPGSTTASRVTVTNGDYGAQMSGIDSHDTGDLKVDETTGWGKTLDAVVKDGTSMQENPAGQGFLSVDNHGQIHAVNQEFVNSSELQNAGKPLSPLENAFKELSNLLSVLVSGSFHGGQQQPAPADGPSPADGPTIHALVQPSAQGVQAIQINQSGTSSPPQNNAAPGYLNLPVPDPLGLGSQQNQADHDPVEHALDPLGFF